MADDTILSTNVGTGDKIRTVEKTVSAVVAKTGVSLIDIGGGTGTGEVILVGGQQVAANSVPVVLTAAQITTLTPVSTVTANAGTNLNTSLLALEAGHLATIDTSTARIPAQGQALAAASTPVVLTAAQITTLTPPAAITNFALDATLTGGTQKAIARSAAKGATTAADITSTAQSADRQGMDVQIRTSAGAVVDTFGGGTQFADGAARGTATGTLLMVDDGTLIQSAKGDASGRQAMNIEQLIGTNVDVNSGTKSAGTLRVVLATDQPALTNKLLVTPDANSAVNVAQINGVTPLMGSGIMGTGSPRVTIASDNDALTVKQATGTNLHVVLDANSGVDIGKLTANQSMNFAQLVGTATDVNSGNKSAGTLRVVLATDQPALTNKLLVTPDALPANQSVNVAQVAGTNTVTGGVNGLQAMAGAAADNAAVSGNPVLNGAVGRSTLKTNVTNGNVTQVVADRYGRLQVVKPNLTNATSNGSAITTNTNTTIVAAPSAGNHLKIYRLFAQNSSATGTWCYWGNGSGVKTRPFYLAQYQMISLNLEGSWELSTATGLFMNTATTGANIEWGADYETVAD